MAQNTMVWLLSKGLNDIATSGETPKFDIKWSLPIYDHLTDGTVMTTPAANPGPDMDDGTTPPTHNQSAPGDFNGLFYVNGLKYSLSQWDTSGTAGVTETTGWAKNPEWSVGVKDRNTSRPEEANTGSNTTFLYGSVSGGTFTGDDYGTSHLSSWSVSNLYENVRYDGTSTEDTDPGEDPRAYAHYTVYLRCEKSEPGIDPTPGFIVGSVRFNKVLLFTDIDGSPSPIAMVCLGTPVALFADNQGQSNSLAISFQLGFNPNDTAVENVSFDNLYWTKVGEYPDHEGDMRLFSRNKLVIGELGESLINKESFIDIQTSEPNVVPFEYRYTPFKNAEHTERVVVQFASIDPACGLMISKFSNGCEISDIPVWGGTTSLSSIDISIDGNVPRAIYPVFSLVARGGLGHGDSTDDIAYQMLYSVIAGAGIDKHTIESGVVVGTNVVSLLSPYQYFSTPYYNRKLSDSLVIGDEINIAAPIDTTNGTLTPVNPDLDVAIGDNNKIYSGLTYSAGPIENHPSRTVLIGKNNQVDNSWCNPTGNPAPQVMNGEVADSYVLGSCNAIGYYAESDTTSFNNSQTKNYVLGNMNKVCNNIATGTASTTKTNRYILGSANTVSLGDTAVVTPDIYIFGSNNTVSIDARSNYYGNNKYVFGSGIAVESWEEFVVGHCSAGLHNEHSAHYNNGAIRLMRMGITQGEYTGGAEQPGCWSLSVVFGGPFGYKDRVYGWNSENNLMLPHKSQVLAYPDKFKSGTLCIDNNSQDGDGKFWNVCYYYPTSNS